MLSNERSFNRLCKLIAQGRDDEETAAEINELMNDLCGAHSELSILRALARRLGRPIGAGSVRDGDGGRGNRLRTGRSRGLEESAVESSEVEAGRHSLRLVASASAGSSRPANHSG